MIQGFKWTHVKRNGGEMVGALSYEFGEISYAYGADGKIYTLAVAEFNRRFRHI